MLKQSKKFCNLRISAALFLYLYILQKNNKSEPVANRHKVRICLLCLSNIKKDFSTFSAGGLELSYTEKGDAAE